MGHLAHIKTTTGKSAVTFCRDLLHVVSHDKKRESVSSEAIIENEQFGNVILEAEERQRGIGCENEQK